MLALAVLVLVRSAMKWNSNWPTREVETSHDLHPCLES